MTKIKRKDSRAIDLRANEMVTEHVKCNVTGLVSALVEHDDADALELMGSGDGEAYSAYEVWVRVRLACRASARAGSPRHAVVEPALLGARRHWPSHLHGHGYPEDRQGVLASCSS